MLVFFILYALGRYTPAFDVFIICQGLIYGVGQLMRHFFLISYFLFLLGMGFYDGMRRDKNILYQSNQLPCVFIGCRYLCRVDKRSSDGCLAFSWR